MRKSIFFFATLLFSVITGAQTAPSYPEGDKSLCKAILQSIKIEQFDLDSGVEVPTFPWAFTFKVKPDSTIDELVFYPDSILSQRTKKKIISFIESVPSWIPATDSIGTPISGDIKIDVVYPKGEEQVWRNYIVDSSIPSNEIPFEIVEQMPVYPGGESEMMKFISTHMRYPVVPEETGFCTRSIIRFVVGADGNISRIHTLRECSEQLDNELIRVFLLMPKWQPGKQNGKNVPVYFTLRVHWHFK